MHHHPRPIKTNKSTEKQEEERDRGRGEEDFVSERERERAMYKGLIWFWRDTFCKRKKDVMRSGDAIGLEPPIRYVTEQRNNV